jgi:hypothetical protein
VGRRHSSNYRKASTHDLLVSGQLLLALLQHALVDAQTDLLVEPLELLSLEPQPLCSRLASRCDGVASVGDILVFRSILLEQLCREPVAALIRRTRSLWSRKTAA